MKRLMAAVIMAFIFSQNIFAAEVESINLEKAASKAAESSLSLRAAKKTYENYVDQYNSVVMASKNPYNIRMLLVGPYQAEYLKNVGENNLDVTQNAVRLSAYTVYMNVLKAKYAVDIQRELLTNLKRDLDKSKLMLDKGMISKTNYRLVEINYRKSELTLQKYERNYESALMGLNNLMGEDIDTKYLKIIDEGIDPGYELGSVDEYINMALSFRSEVKNAQSSLELKEKEFEYGKTQVQPRYDVYLEETQASIDSAKNSLEDAKVSVELNVIKAYDDADKAVKNAVSLKKLYEAAEGNFKIAENKFKNNMISMYEFENARINLAQSKMQLKMAELDAWLYEAKLNMASGSGPAF